MTQLRLSISRISTVFQRKADSTKLRDKAKMKTSRVHFPRNRIALGIKAVTIILLTMATYFQDLVLVANEAIRSEFMIHTLAMPFLLSYLV